MEIKPKPYSNWINIEQEPDLIIYQVTDKLQKVLDKVDEGDWDTLTHLESKNWLQHFCYIISDGFSLSSEQILNSHDGWLRTIEYHSNITESQFKLFEDQIPEMCQWDRLTLLNYIVTFFELPQLATVDINHMS